MTHETLILIWSGLLAVLLIGYAILDGFDFGVGILHSFVPRDDRERRVFINSIGPLWDGNEVWLVTFGGALFAAFPGAYATTFSAFYTAFMALLFALIAALGLPCVFAIDSYRTVRTGTARVKVALTILASYGGALLIAWAIDPWYR